MSHYRDNAIRLLVKGFSSEFAEFVTGHEKLKELMIELASEFVTQNIPIIKEEDQIYVEVELLESVAVKEV